MKSRSDRRRRHRALLEAMEPRLLLAGGSLQGIAWNDLNGDGVRGAGEPLLSNWTIYLDANHNAKLDVGETSTLTGMDGRYAFDNLGAGNYLIGAVVKAGWNQTFPSVTNPAVATNVAAAAAPIAAGTTDSVSASLERAEQSSLTAEAADSAEGWVVGLLKSANAGAVLTETGASSFAASRVMADTYVVNYPTDVKGSDVAARLAVASDVAFYYPLIARQQSSRFIPNDPLFGQEWHLLNTGQFGGLSGADANVTPVWDQYQGAGVVVGVVDDGLQYTHPDLRDNYDSIDSYDFDDNDNNPAPNVNRDLHGTAVAGIVAARGNNGIGVSGAAPQASLAGLRLTDTDTTDAQEAAALSYHRNTIAIYSNSWGPDDDGERLEGPGPMTLQAMKDSVALGRGGKGSIYVWAAGNGLESNDNVNYDGYANSRYVIATTALDDSGRQAYYAEPGAPILVSAYGAGVTPGIMTTDLRGSNGFNGGNSSGSYTNDYFNNFGGTSASAPLVSGVVALMLDANPNLGWRDVKQILVNTARKNDPGDAGWSLNGAGHWVNHKYGFGAIDAQAAVNAALTWTNLAPETSVTSGLINVGQTIPDNDTTGVTSSVTINDLLKVETVEVIFDATHPARGDLRVVLTSPDGTQSVLAEVHDDSNANYSQWTFSSTRHWDEIAKGTWTLQVTDGAGEDVGTWNSWKLNIYGTAVTSEHYVALAANAVVTGQDFGFRPLGGAKVELASFPYQTGQLLIFNFDQDVASSISSDDLELKNDTTGAILPASALRLSYDSASRTAVWSFYGLDKGLLPDGNYTARLKASQITLTDGAMLDGNRDGVGGDDFTFTFFQLKGDANRDRVVNTADVKILFANQATSNPTWDQADFNYDGKVDFIDYQYLEVSLGNALPAPAAGGVFSVVQCPAELATALTVSTARPAPLRPVMLARPTFSVQPLMRREIGLLD